MQVEYVHESLPDGPFTRILRMTYQESAPNPTIDFELVDLGSENITQYIAISYAWEDASPFNKIATKDGRYIWLSRTLSELFDSLSRLYPSDSIALWIDALCIDQSKSIEKAHQVNLMGIVYSRARHVLIWLGAEDEETASVFQLIQSKWKAAMWPQGSEKRLLGFLNRPWFGRVWVIQEAVMNRSTYFVCGDRTASFTEIRIALNSLRGLNEVRSLLAVVSPSIHGFWRANKICQMRRIFERKHHVHLLFVLEATLKFSATDTSDFVFALRGFASDSQLLSEPNYTISPEDVFQDTSIRLLGDGSYMDILALSGLGPRSVALRDMTSYAGCTLPNITSLPSWALDFRLKFFDDVFVIREYTGWCTGGPILVPPKFSSRNKLPLTGMIFDVIESVGPLADVKCWDAMKQTINQCFQMVESIHSTWNNASPSAMIANALITAFKGDATPSSDRFARVLERLRSTLENGTTIEDTEEIGYYRMLQERGQGLRTFTTPKGCFGLSWPIIERGDMICLIPGCSVPIVVRSTDSGSPISLKSNTLSGVLIGWGYVQGIMYGEGLTDLTKITIELV